VLVARSAPSNLLAGLRRRDGAEPIAAGSARSRIGSGITPGTGEPFGSLVGMICMSTTFPSAGRARGLRLLASELNGSSVAGTKLSVEIAVRCVPGGALREVASQER
jgi:hypothetical protein